VLTLGALAGSLCIIATVAAALFDVTPLVFRSGSMAPAIHTGALALSRTVPADELKVGDIVSVPTASGVRVTHRIESLQMRDDQASLVLKGDANEVSDAAPYLVDSAERVFWDIPKAGFVVAKLASPVGAFAGGLLVAVVLLIAFNPAPSRPVVPSRPIADAPRRRTVEPNRGSKHLAVTIGAALVVAGGTGVGLPTPVPTMASWTDTASASSGTMDAHKLVPPSPVDCAVVSTGLTTKGLRYSWTGVDPRYTYQVERIDSVGVVWQTDKIADNGAPGATYSVTYDETDLPNGNFTVRVTTFLTSTPVWGSGDSTMQKGAKSTTLLLVVSLSC